MESRQRHLNRLFPDCFPQIPFGLWGSGSMHVDVASKVQIELLENRDQGLDVIVCRLTLCRQREGSLEENLLLGEERDQ